MVQRLKKEIFKMRTFTTFGIIVCLLSLLSAPANALRHKKQLHLAEGEFEIPAEIKKATKVTGLQPFLDSKREFMRMAAVRRLAEIEGPNSIGPLLEVFRKEPAARGLHDIPLVKFEIIRMLGRIGTDQAKAALLDILKDYWQKGPNVKDKRGFLLDRDFTTVMPFLLETLDRWCGDEDVFKTVETIALSEDVKKFYTESYGIGQKAWEVYLKGTMKRKGIVKDEDFAMYLLNFMDDIIEPVGYGTLNSAKKMAALSVFKKQTEAALSDFLKILQDRSKKESRGPGGSVTNRHMKLLVRIGFVKEVLREKKEKEERASNKSKVMR